MTAVFIRERRGKSGHTYTHRRKGHVKMEAEIGMVHLQTTEHQGLPAVTRTRKKAWNISSLRASLVAQSVKNLPAVKETRVQSLGWEDPLEKLKWQPTSVSLPGKSHGHRSLVGCSPWGHKELGTTERLTLTYLLRASRRKPSSWFRTFLVPWEAPLGHPTPNSRCNHW